MRLATATAACLFTLLVALPSFAQTPAAAPQPAEAKPEPKKFESSAGLKLLLGGNVWSTPGNIQPAGYDALGFAGNGGGFGWGTAVYYEARFIQHLGVELDIGYDSSTLQRDVTYTNTTFNVSAKVREKVTASGLRWGLLFKGIAHAPFGRMWAGIGPEFVSGSSVSAKNEITEGKSKVSNASDIENAISAKSKSSTMLTLALGMAIELGEHFEIPIDLRAAKNLSQESDWNKRVDTTNLFSNPPKYEVTAQSSWDFRLGLGVGYRF